MRTILKEFTINQTSTGEITTIKAKDVNDAMERWLQDGDNEIINDIPIPSMVGPYFESEDILVCPVKSKNDCKIFVYVQTDEDTYYYWSTEKPDFHE